MDKKYDFFVATIRRWYCDKCGIWGNRGAASHITCWDWNFHLHFVGIKQDQISLQKRWLQKRKKNLFRIGMVCVRVVSMKIVLRIYWTTVTGLILIYLITSCHLQCIWNICVHLNDIIQYDHLCWRSCSLTNSPSAATRGHLISAGTVYQLASKV